MIHVTSDVIAVLKTKYEIIDGKIRHIRSGKPAEWKSRSGYMTCCLDLSTGKRVRTSSHRIVYAFANGPIPEGMEIDHINRIRDDNRVCNLRAVSASDNRHRSIKPRKSSLPKGVYYRPTINKKNPYTATITVGGNNHNLGYFSNKELASAAYSECSKEWFKYND